MYPLLERVLFHQVGGLGSVDTRDVVKFFLLVLEGIIVATELGLVDICEVISLHEAEALVMVDKGMFALHSLVLVGKTQLLQVGSLVANICCLELAGVDDLALLLVVGFGADHVQVFGWILEVGCCTLFKNCRKSILNLLEITNTMLLGYFLSLIALILISCECFFGLVLSILHIKILFIEIQIEIIVQIGSFYYFFWSQVNLAVKLVSRLEL